MIIISNNNKEILEKHFPDAWNQWCEIEENLNTKLTKVVPSQQGTKTLRLSKGNKLFIHNKNDPLKEAEDFINQYETITEHSDILFYGVGLGYHIKAFVNKYPNKSFYIYEPIPEIFEQYLLHGNLGELPLESIKEIYIENSQNNTAIFLQNFISKIWDSILVIDFPTYKKAFSQKHNDFFFNFQQAIDNRSNNIAVNSAFEKRWIINSMHNFGEVLNSPNIMISEKQLFENKPALLVAAGPSLEEEIENIKHIKENNLAYIFAVGSAINTLIKYDLSPHAFCSFDPSEKNQLVFTKIIEKNINSIPLIFGSSIGFESLKQYPGPKLHMITSQDQVAPLYLKSSLGTNIDGVSDAPSVAAVTLELLYKMKFNPIILVGQNLAYKDNKRYAGGINYHPVNVNANELEQAESVKDVYGNKVPTAKNFTRMRQQMEMYIQHFKNTEVINTTRGGAHIEGTTFKTLETLIKNKLQNEIVNDNWLSYEAFSYDKEHIKSKLNFMQKEFESLDNLFNATKSLLSKIEELAQEGKFQQIDLRYQEFDNVFAQLRANSFFNSFILPMNRVISDLLQLEIPDINKIKDPLTKARRIVNRFETFFSDCEKDIQDITPIFLNMNKSIKNFLIKEQFKQIKLMLINYEVLTDGSIYCAINGEEIIKLNAHDRSAIQYLKENNIELAIMSRKNYPEIQTISKALKIKHVYENIKDTPEFLADINKKHNISNKTLACISNNIKDIDIINNAALSFTANNCTEKLRDRADYVCTKKSGEGVLKEIVDQFL